MNITFRTFDIKISSGDPRRTDKFYYNGRQQVTLVINIIKQVDGVDTPLTEDEKESVTLASKKHPKTPLSSPWFCDKVKNQYDEGIRGEVINSNTINENKSKQGDTNPETIYRYFRAEASDKMELVATVTINGKIYSSSTQDDKVVTILPRAPYKVEHRELKLEQKIAYLNEFETRNYISISFYSWGLPDSLYIKEYKVLCFKYEAIPEGGIIGRNLPGEDPARMSVMLKRDILDIPVKSLIRTENVPGGDTILHFPIKNNEFRATLGFCDNRVHHERKINEGCMAEIVDNFGCRHTFLVETTNDFSSLYLVD
ncbi:hypothetical protein [Xenorhabdus sp. KK7.4]|uniref:hypothetical protein n=1 Tax=Xenorhabdus sp. KK7.4 TaxID=1851572 RepID=UPI000C04928B|nr:hypothetical protein [Xenorhabdus sp. KK7.4]PHM59851.1 hypothetical protein Xekk_00289 [Xenorhabdus sp. KK7.4]